MGKSKRKITNWKQYNQALVNRGSLTFWMDEAAIDTWLCKEHH
ncbi:IS5/IS1182 family transposase, partial [Photobacterium sp. ZSDE20]|nr:IS5/IS1182 family transposase [Photobacterium sp. ZSDE20]